MTEHDKMIAGEPYDASDPDLVQRRVRAAELCRALTGAPPGDAAARRRVIELLLGAIDDGAMITPPFFCDYGSNIELGERVFVNTGCVFLDVCKIRIGRFTQIGPSVQIYTATHPLDPIARRSLESGEPVEVGEDVWIGGGAIVLPGVRIGERSVIGAGSVVTRDVPDGVIAAGNPCRVLRSV